MQNIMATCVETASAARLLAATSNKPLQDAAPIDPLMDQGAVEMLRNVLMGDANRVRASWEQFLVALRPKSLLYLPHFKGGRPQTTVATRVLQRLVHDLLGWLPRLGLVRETCQLLDRAQQMESDHPVGQGAVTEFDRLFENGYQSIVRCLIAAAELWDQDPSPARAAQSDHLLVDALQQLTEQQLERWLAHSRTLRLGVVEKLAEPAPWNRFEKFVRQFGAQLFTQTFLGSRGNLRGILHQGVNRWISQLLEDEGAYEIYPFLESFADDELSVEAPQESGSKKSPERWSRTEFVELLTIAIETVDENYSAYRDYNTTTTQSDHGELFYQFVDFLRLRAAYDRVAWNLKPVVWAHEILVRHGRHVAAEMWRQAFTERTSEAADFHLARLARLSTEYGMQLPSVAERLHERFVRPLVIDRLRALVEPAMTSSDEGSGRESFAALQRDIADLTDQPQGSGLDVPDWLAALEDEVTEARSRLNHVSALDRIDRRIAQVALSFPEIFSELADP